MTNNTEKIARELEKIGLVANHMHGGKIGALYNFVKVAKHVEALVLQGKIEELDRVLKLKGGAVSRSRYESLTKELGELNEKTE